ncbi:uncharacterized protein [Physcomitrium patens]|uniref:Uncharacterized protein n=1 Tax=Physcomitrium patens TaxID=3218 RepID=A0A2K1J0F5_PHYPA|nr:uncharacterized protein LOC112295098 isoform X2 [Physcomitrium patens]PNR34999.1 hypothetical protein PHYPA_022898 [Physcomitrium patens]|eukprot:XP_024402049.1 uncharacterized protein LOC112295098 isoform X2 [Physcomitrella patens]
MHRYTKDALLALASLPSCQLRLDGIDPVLLRDSVNSDVEGNIAIPAVPSGRGSARKDVDFAYSKSPVNDLPEWRRPNGGGAIIQSGARRKPYEEEPLGNAFSTSYPPRPSGPWVEQTGPSRPPHDRPGPNGASVPPGKWDGNGDRDRERGRLPQVWDAKERGSSGKGDAEQRPWIERDGLLGSGIRPPPQAHARISRSTGNYQPSRSPIKTGGGATPIFGRREDTDIVNDETFGLSEIYTDDRSDQERKRRESFELMRKEQHRKVQEQKQPAKTSENSTVNRKHDENSLWDNVSCQSPPLSPTGKVAVTPPIPTPPRPAVPPGFLKVALQRFSSNQVLPQQDDDAQGAHNHPSKENLVKDHPLLNSNEADDSSSLHSGSSVGDVTEVKCATPIAKEMIIELDVIETKTVVTEVKEDCAANCSLPSGGSLSGKNAPGMWNFNVEGQDGDAISDTLSTGDKSSIRKESLLDKLFGNTIPTVIDDVLPTHLSRDEPHMAAPEEDNFPGSVTKSSKFAHWFHAEEAKLTASQTNSSKNLMSIFGSREKPNNNVFLKKDFEHSGVFAPIIKPGFNVGLPMPVGSSVEDIEKVFAAMGEVPTTSNLAKYKNDSTGKSITPNKQPPAAPPVFMTCEDIEQALLAEAAEADTKAVSSRAPPLVPVVVAPPNDAENASQHLLSLLKRPPILETGLSSKALAMEAGSQSLSSELPRNKPELGNNRANEVPTLESLFGKAFMNELQSFGGAAGRTFPDEGSVGQQSELLNTSFPLQTEDLNHKLRPNGIGVPRDLLASSGPQWGNADAIKNHNNMSMDGLNAAMPSFGETSFGQTHIDAVVKNMKPLPGSSAQHLGAPLEQRNTPRAPLGSANASFSHPAPRPQAPGPVFNSNGLNPGFDAFPPQQHIQPSHAFHGPISHPPPHLMGQLQILQRPQLHHGMIMPEHVIMKTQLPGGTVSAHIPSVHHIHGQHLPNQVPPSGFSGRFESEFQRTNNNSLGSSGVNAVGNIERWFGNDGRRSGLLEPSSKFPQAPVGVQGDMKLRY